MSGAVLSLPIARARPASISGDDRVVPVECDGVECIMRADLVEQLLSSLVQTQRGSISDRNAAVVKTGPHRTVYRLTPGDEEFYLKHFRIAGRMALLQNLFQPCKAEREWHAARGIARLGLPTFEPVALGRLRRGGIVHDSFLVSRGIPDSVPLDQFVTAELQNVGGRRPTGERAIQQNDLRHRLAAALGALAARLHQAGVEHADFHAANILVRVEADGTPALWLIDLHRLHFRRRLSSPLRHRNLALLHQFFAGQSTRSDRLRFYRAYRREWDGDDDQHDDSGGSRGPHQVPPGALPEFALLETTLAAAAQTGWRRADRAWKRGNRHVRIRNAGSVACRGLAALNVAWLDEVRNEPERLLRDNLVRWHKQSRQRRVAEIRLPAASLAPSRNAFLKCFEPCGLWRQWLAPFRLSPARRCWELGHALLRRGIDTPRPILYVECPAAESRKCYLLTEAVPDCLSAAEFFATGWSQMIAVERRDWLAVRLRQLALQIRRLHAGGFDHRDPKFANLLVARDPADPRIWFLDLDGMRAWRHLPAGRAAQNLARLLVSALAIDLLDRAGRLRFLRSYLADDFRREWKWWWRRIAQLAEAKISINRRRGRIVS